MAVVPLISAVGRVFTVTTALLLRSAAIDAHLLSLTAVKVYILFVVGVTVKV